MKTVLSSELESYFETGLCNGEWVTRHINHGERTPFKVVIFIFENVIGFEGMVYEFYQTDEKPRTSCHFKDIFNEEHSFKNIPKWEISKI